MNINKSAANVKSLRVSKIPLSGQKTLKIPLKREKKYQQDRGVWFTVKADRKAIACFPS
jgi:hypothetical protein